VWVASDQPSWATHMQQRLRGVGHGSTQAKLSALPGEITAEVVSGVWRSINSSDEFRRIRSAQLSVSSCATETLCAVARHWWGAGAAVAVGGLRSVESGLTGAASSARDRSAADRLSASPAVMQIQPSMQNNIYFKGKKICSA